MILLYISTVLFSYFTASLSLSFFRDSFKEKVYHKDYYTSYLNDVSTGKEREDLEKMEPRSSFLKEMLTIFFSGAFIAFLWVFAQAAVLFVIHYFFKFLLWIKLVDLSRFSTFGLENTDNLFIFVYLFHLFVVIIVFWTTFKLHEESIKDDIKEIKKINKRNMDIKGSI